ncbi:MAG: CdaR family protein [Flavobacteriaceae bacterium]
MIQRLKSILINWIQIKRLNVFVLFLVLAFIISMVAKLSNQLSQTLQLKLIPTQLSTKEILTENKPNYVYVTIKTQGFNMLKYAFKDLAIEIDVTKLEKDGSFYHWRTNPKDLKLLNYFDSDVIVEAITPNTVSFTYDVQSLKKIPVVVRATYEFALGYDLLNDLKSQPDSVTVVGPKVLLDSISNVFTSDLLLTDVKKDINQTVALEITPNLSFSNKFVQIKGKVDKFTEGKLNIPVSVINLPEAISLSIFPKEVPVVFYTNLNSYNSIDATDFVVVCDYNRLDTSTNVLTPILESYPPTIKNASLQINKLEYVINKSND